MSEEESPNFCTNYKLSLRLIDVLHKFYTRKSAEILQLCGEESITSTKTGFDKYQNWIEGGTNENIKNTLIFRHAPSLANEMQASGLLGRVQKSMFVKDPRLFLPPGSQDLIFIPEFAIKNIKTKITEEKKVINVAVSQLKRTWMTALLILSKCEVDSDATITLSIYKSLNEIGRGTDNSPTTDQNEIENQKNKATFFAEQIGLRTTDIKWVVDLSGEINLGSYSKHTFVVSHGEKMRRELLGWDQSKSKKYGKIVGNLAVCSIDGETVKLLSPGIPKMEIKKILCKKPKSDECKTAKDAKRITGDSFGKKVDKEQYKKNFFTCTWPAMKKVDTLVSL